MPRFRIHAAPIRIGDSDVTVYGENTWVSTDDPGVRWPCLVDTGRSNAREPGQLEAGRVIAEVDGVLPVATCLGDPVAADFEGLPSAAGIVYGVNGVSHQVANRILFDTGCDVRAAEGAWNSWWLFGTYGTTIPAAKLLGPVLGPVGSALGYAIGAGSWLDWERRKKRCGTTRTALDDIRALPDQVKQMRDEVASLSDTALAATRSRSIELAGMLSRRLGDSVSARTLGDIQEFFVSESRSVVANTQGLVTGEPAARETSGEPTRDADAVARDCNSAFTRHFAEVAVLLGSDAYVRVFGSPPDAPVVLLDPAILARGR